MASLKNKFNRATGRSNSVSDEPEAQRGAEQYRLQVTAGSAYDRSTHTTVHVNTGKATYVENQFIRAKVQVRIRAFKGVPSSCPSSSPYFDHPSHQKDQYSLAFSFVPKVDIPSEGTVWGNDFDHPVRDRLPPGFNTAFKIVKEFIDPGLSCDAYADEPWLYGPSLSCWFAFRIGETVGLDQDFAAPAEDEPMLDGADGSGLEVRKSLRIPDNNEKRRKHFLDAQNRRDFTFEKGRCYQADFYNPYLDFGNYALKLPGFSLKVIKYVDQKSHCLRYVFKNRESGDVYLNVNFELLWGEDLKLTLVAEKEKESTREHDDPDGQWAGGRGTCASSQEHDQRRAKAVAPQDSPQEPHEDSENTAIFIETASAHAEAKAGNTEVKGEMPQYGAKPESDGTAEPRLSEICKLLEATATIDRREKSQKTLAFEQELVG